jgi:hypothetical protein
VSVPKQREHTCVLSKHRLSKSKSHNNLAKQSKKKNMWKNARSKSGMHKSSTKTYKDSAESKTIGARPKPVESDDSTLSDSHNAGNECSQCQTANTKLAHKDSIENTAVSIGKVNVWHNRYS